MVAECSWCAGSIPGQLDCFVPARYPDDASTILTVLRCSQLGSDNQQRGQYGTGHNAIPMPVHIIFQTGIAGWISTGQVVECQRRGIRQDDSVPNDLNPTLPIDTLASVFPQYDTNLKEQQ